MAQNPDETLQYHSSHRIDHILWRLFDEKRDGFFVDIGAGNGVTESPTCLLEQVGWTGICIEPNPQAYLQCLRARPKSRVVHAAASRRGTWKVGTFSVVLGAEEMSYLEATPAHLERVKRTAKRAVQIPVPVLNMDYLLELHTEPVDAVCLDVCGSELDVLDGFNLEKSAPTVLVIRDNSDGQEVLTTDYVARQSYIHAARVGPYGFYLTPELYQTQKVFV